MRSRSVAALGLGLYGLCAGALRTARADDAGIAAGTEVADDADDHATVQAALGAGSDGGAIALTELRAGWTGSGLAIELGGRLRWRDGVLVRTDWDHLGDWLGVVRRLELSHHGATVAGAVGAGRLAPVTLGAVVDGYSTAALLDRRAPGAITRIRTAGMSVDAAVDDVTAPTLIAGGIELALAGRWHAVAAVAIDPARDRMDLPAIATVELGARWIAGPLALGGVVVAGVRGGLAAVARGDVAGRRGRLSAGATLEARGYDGATVAAPFGPLWPIEREQAMTGGGTGVATAITARLGFDGVGVIEAGVRSRGGRGDLVTARFALPWWRAVQAGGYAAIGIDDAIAAGEVRVMWTPRWFSAFEAGRGYRRDDAGALVGVWQAAAWFGATAGW